MDAWGEIRLKARAWHQKAFTKTNESRKANALCTQALADEDLQLELFEPDSIAGPSVLGFLDRSSKLVYVLKGQAPDEEAVVVAHEIGHYHLHPDAREEVTSISQGLGGDPIDSGAGRVQGYSPRERREIQAEIFAGEFLCPSDWLRGELLSGRKPTNIAADLGIPINLVVNQAIRALLLPPLRPVAESKPVPVYTLDDSQREAAAWNQGPLLVNAGPGTGKTRTLVHRIQQLLENGASPTSILALTFSNKAAEEMRERLSAANGDAAIEMWVGTFHAFGMELVSKYHERIGRTANLQILDEAGSLAVLEENLERLPLRHYQNLYEPAYELVHVLRAISRCKDELITPQVYRAAAEAAAAVATEDQREDADKALEVAAVYEIYEEALKKADAVDFGDLVMLAAQILERNPDIQTQYQQDFEHVLVDEYQDVNSASSRLLRALCRQGGDVWVVADQRQSIYRFRGAQPSNVQRFEAEFSGQKRSLKINYRSGSPVVGIFQMFASRMKVGIGGTWTPKRGNVGGLGQVVGPTIEEEAAAIHANIEAARRNGIPYADQAILARSHLTLARITTALERLGVPLLYLGDTFERSEIRDLLSLLSIDAEPGGTGLLRVAQFDEYDIPREDALTLIAWSQAKNTTIVQALGRVNEVDGLSDAGRSALALLGSHLEGVTPGTTPWALLSSYLFERSSFLTRIVTANDAKAQQQRIAIYQFLKICGEMASAGYTTRRQLLARVRRIEALNDDRIYRAVSSEASDMNAVRVMTIHGSKGLEFGAVHLPALATTYMPSNRQWVRCPAPASLSALAPPDHDAEEECLFFVALSRARDFLFLSRAERYTSRNSSASKFLASLSSLAPPVKQPQAPVQHQTPPSLTPAPPRQSYQERELALYLQCPARYRHEIVHDLRGASDATPYVRFHRCVYRTIGWLEAQRRSGKAAGLPAALAQLADEWGTGGPTAHGFNRYYRTMAEGMITSMVEVIAAETGRYDRDDWDIQVNGKEIRVTPDRVIVDSGGAVHVQRIRTGRKSKSEGTNRIYALLRRGAQAKYPGQSISIETFYPAAREVVVVAPLKEDQLLGEYRGAINDIERGSFAADPEDARRCPNCQCYFICDFVNGVS